jgi:hypothetical protein
MSIPDFPDASSPTQSVLLVGFRISVNDLHVNTSTPNQTLREEKGGLAQSRMHQHIAPQ